MFVSICSKTDPGRSFNSAANEFPQRSFSSRKKKQVWPQIQKSSHQVPNAAMSPSWRWVGPKTKSEDRKKMKAS